jgi:hypothetical protein
MWNPQKMKNLEAWGDSPVGKYLMAVKSVASMMEKGRRKIKGRIIKGRVIRMREDTERRRDAGH